MGDMCTIVGQCADSLRRERRGSLAPATAAAPFGAASASCGSGVAASFVSASSIAIIGPPGRPPCSRPLLRSGVGLRVPLRAGFYPPLSVAACASPPRGPAGASPCAGSRNPRCFGLSGVGAGPRLGFPRYSVVGWLPLVAPSLCFCLRPPLRAPAGADAVGPAALPCALRRSRRWLPLVAPARLRRVNLSVVYRCAGRVLLAALPGVPGPLSGLPAAVARRRSPSAFRPPGRLRRPRSAPSGVRLGSARVVFYRSCYIYDRDV